MERVNASKAFPDEVRITFSLQIHALSSKTIAPKLNKFEARYLQNSVRYTAMHEWPKVSPCHIYMIRKMFMTHCEGRRDAST